MRYVEPFDGVGGSGSRRTTVRSTPVWPPRGPTISYWPERGAGWPGLRGCAICTPFLGASDHFQVPIDLAETSRHNAPSVRSLYRISYSVGQPNLGEPRSSPEVPYLPASNLSSTRHGRRRVEHRFRAFRRPRNYIRGCQTTLLPHLVYLFHRP
jgi:hypothetical protein